MFDARGAINFHRAFRLIVVSFFYGIIMLQAITNASPRDVNGERLSISIIGDHQVGTNAVGIWISSGKVRVSLSNAFDKNFDGAGVVDSILSADDLKSASDVFKKICQRIGGPSSKDLPPDTLNVYSIRCMRNGEMTEHQGRLTDLPRDLAIESFGLYQKLLTDYISSGQVVVKVGASVSAVRREREDFLVTVKFSNAGQYGISMRTPDEWEKNWQERLDIGGRRVGRGDLWKASLVGRRLYNKSDLSIRTEELPMGGRGTFVTIPAGGAVEFKFLVAPDQKIPKGTYKFSVLVVTTMTTEGDAPNLSRVNFSSNSARAPNFTFDTDYPATPNEWKDFEARQREKMSSQSVGPGATVAEPGYYRKVAITGERGQFVRGLSKGEQAPTLDRPFEHWVWDADLALSTRCKPGDSCPRDGLWVARTMRMGSVDADVTHVELERRFRAGEIAPSLTGLEGNVLHHYWQWLGA